MLLRESSDGSLSAYNALFDECYHSLKDGALSETLHKHIYPSLIHLVSINKRLSSTIKHDATSLESSTYQGILQDSKYLPNELCILDICFGLGYNSFTLLAFLNQMGYEGKVKIYSPEQDESLFSALLDFSYPPLLAPYKKHINEVLFFFANAPTHTLNTYNTAFGEIKSEFCIYKGDALVMLHLLLQESFHIIYQDAFSPKKNPTLWSEEYFCMLYRLLHPQGIITTYSQSSAVIKNALKAQFKVYNYESHIVRGGSVMGKNPIHLPSLKAR